MAKKDKEELPGEEGNEPEEKPEDEESDKPEGEGGEAADKPEGDKKLDKTFTKAERDAHVNKELEKAKKKWEKEKDLPEVERLKKENQELSEKQREREVADGFTTAAEKAGAKNTARLLKIYRADLEISDDGKIENLKDVLNQAKEDMPEFFPSKTPGKSDAEKGKKDADLSYGEKVDAEFEKTGRKNAFKI